MAQCRSANDSGTPDVEYFSKDQKMVEISRVYSMGAGNSLVLGVSTSERLHRYDYDGASGPPVVVDSAWVKYSIPEIGLTFKYPPHWHVSETNLGGENEKYVRFEDNNFTDVFAIAARIGEIANDWRGTAGEEPEMKCAPSVYKISGIPAEQCVSSGEQVGTGICSRPIYLQAVRTNKYALRFRPGAGALPDASGKLRMEKLYEKILETIRIREAQ